MVQQSRILIVDDSDMNTRVASIALEREEYEIRAVHSGADALEAAAAETFDLILLDIMMPGMDGYTVCRHLKQNPDTMQIPIIFLTARSDVESIRNAFTCGGSDFISKPFQKAELIARVETQLRLKAHVEKIEAVSNERNELLHILSHDLANPLSAALAVVTMMEDDPEYAVDGLPVLRKALQNGSEIIHFIHTVRSLEKNNFRFEISYQNLLEMVDEAEMMLSHLWKPKKQRIVRDIGPGLSVCVERNSFINSVLNNVLSNAVKFSHPGSEIRISGKMRDGENAIVSIQDSGIGIPEEILEKLFSFSSKVSRSGTEGESGTGYGMPLVKRFVEAYGGRVEVASEGAERGTVVSFMLTAKE